MTLYTFYLLEALRIDSRGLRKELSRMEKKVLIKWCRKLPIEVEYVTWDGSIECLSIVEDWIGDGPQADFTVDEPTLTIPTLEGDMLASLGDKIIRGVAGEVYPIKPDIFQKSYEDV